MKKIFPAYAAALVLITVIITAFSTKFNTNLMASGVFRFGNLELNSKSEILFHRDGRTASVIVTSWDNKNIGIFKKNSTPNYKGLNITTNMTTINISVGISLYILKNLEVFLLLSEAKSLRYLPKVK